MVKNSTKGQALKSFCFISGVWKHSHTKRAYDGCQIDRKSTWEMVGWIVCHYDDKHLAQRLLLAMYLAFESEQ